MTVSRRALSSSAAARLMDRHPHLAHFVVYCSKLGKLVVMYRGCSYACTAFAFGQTGSGKTHTITGPPEQVGMSIIVFNAVLFVSN